MAATVSLTKAFFWAFLVSCLGEICNGDQGIFNVDQFGAKSDGITDNSAAFSAAWNAACGSTGDKATLQIPAGTYLTGPVTFQGPCKGANTIVEVIGKVIAPKDSSKFPSMDWIMFSHIDKLLLLGGGVFDGQGAYSWPHSVAPSTPNEETLPTSLQFNFISNSIVTNISLLNSKQKHVKVYGSQGLDLYYLTITAPGDSPNTDGINIGRSSNIGVYDSNIGTGDDCITVLDGCNDVFVSNVFCGPGHGISVGSLGTYANEKDVNTFRVTKSTFTGTMNGLRIKTWAKSKSSISVTNITFENIIMKDVSNPIIIDQHYCPHGYCVNSEPSSSVKIRGVSFKDVTGTSASKVAVTLDCSESNPCQDVRLENINLKSFGGGAPLTSFCSSVQGSSTGTQIPPACI